MKCIQGKHPHGPWGLTTEVDYLSTARPFPPCSPDGLLAWKARSRGTRERTALLCWGRGVHLFLCLSPPPPAALSFCFQAHLFPSLFSLCLVLTSVLDVFSPLTPHSAVASISTLSLTLGSRGFSFQSMAQPYL